MPGNSIHLLWIVDIIAEFATATVIYRRRAHTSFPVFFSLLIFLCVKSLTLLALSILDLPTPYFYVYWAGAAMRAILIGGVLGELSSSIMKRSRWLPSHLSRDCVVVSGVVVALAVLSCLHRGIQYAEGICGLARLANEIVSWSFLVVMAAMLALSGLLEVTWNRRTVGITAGLLVELWVGSLCAVLAELFGRAGIDASNWVRLSTFVITNCIWIASFLLSETTTRMKWEPSPCAQETRA